jgi:hypothetical protein
MAVDLDSLNKHLDSTFAALKLFHKIENDLGLAEARRIFAMCCATPTARQRADLKKPICLRSMTAWRNRTYSSLRGCSLKQTKRCRRKTGMGHAAAQTQSFSINISADWWLSGPPNIAHIAH